MREDTMSRQGKLHEARKSIDELREARQKTPVWHWFAYVLGVGLLAHGLRDVVLARTGWVTYLCFAVGVPTATLFVKALRKEKEHRNMPAVLEQDRAQEEGHGK